MCVQIKAVGFFNSLIADCYHRAWAISLWLLIKYAAFFSIDSCKYFFWKRNVQHFDEKWAIIATIDGGVFGWNKLKHICHRRERHNDTIQKVQFWKEQKSGFHWNSIDFFQTIGCMIFITKKRSFSFGTHILRGFFSIFSSFNPFRGY